MDTDNIQAVIDAARQGVPPSQLHKDSHSLVLYTQMRGIEIVDLTKFDGAPHRRQGLVTVYEAESFNKLIADNEGAGDITVYVHPDVSTPSIVAVMNGHGPHGAGWGDFKIRMAFRETEQWKKWKSIDGKMLPQVDFAEFIEENLSDVVQPDGATVMEIVTYLEATRSVDFKSGVKLSSGSVQLTNIENVEAKVGPGKIEVPDQFSLALSPFFGIAPFAIPARFRYRLQNGKLTLGLKLQRIEDIMVEIMKDIELNIALPEGAAKVYGIAP